MCTTSKVAYRDRVWHIHKRNGRWKEQVELLEPTEALRGADKQHE